MDLSNQDVFANTLMLNEFIQNQKERNKNFLEPYLPLKIEQRPKTEKWGFGDGYTISRFRTPENQDENYAILDSCRTRIDQIVWQMLQNGIDYKNRENFPKISDKGRLWDNVEADGINTILKDLRRHKELYNLRPDAIAMPLRCIRMLCRQRITIDMYKSTSLRRMSMGKLFNHEFDLLLSEIKHENLNNLIHLRWNHQIDILSFDECYDIVGRNGQLCRQYFLEGKYVFLSKAMGERHIIFQVYDSDQNPENNFIKVAFKVNIYNPNTLFAREIENTEQSNLG